MSFSRQVVTTVILTLIISALSTVFCSPEAKPTEKPLSIQPVVMGPSVPKLSAVKALRTVKETIRTRVEFPEARRAMASIVTARPKVERDFAIARTGANASTVIDFAMAQIGDPYVWGGNGPNGWDCSGLMVGAFRTVGVNLPRTSRSQYTVGSPVAHGEWLPGDLLFFGASAGSIHHVVLYIGNGQIVHASTFGVPVKVDSVKGGGSDYFGARRVF